MGEKIQVILYVDELDSELASGIPFCRICHETEFESCKSLESPCSCSGTLKFAHRDCIQRWCDEKENTTCEICLQNFESDYTAPIKKAQLLDAAVTIRGSLEVPRRERGQQNQDLDATSEEEELLENECSLEAADRRANCFRVVALIVTILLLMRHLLTLLTGGTEDYPLTLLTLLIAKTSGIVLPMYAMIRIITSIHNSFRNRHQYEDVEEEESNSEGGEDDEDDEQHNLEHRVEIHST